MTVLKLDNDRSPMHHKPALPLAAEYAARLQAGETLTGLAASYGRGHRSVAQRLNDAGYAYSRTRGWVIAGQDKRPNVSPFPRVPDFFDDALCAETDPEMFFPEKGGSTVSAKLVCRACPVRIKCLEYALETGESEGIWGGLTPSERRSHMRRIRAS